MLGNESGARLPNFLIVGVPKAGTTTLHRCLREHPEVFMPERKELHFFSHRYLIQHCSGPGDAESLARLNCRTLDDYRGYFREVEAHKAVGEASPSYFFFAECITDIKRTLGGGVKIIVVLRNPVQRAFSNWQHMVSLGKERLGFPEAMAAEGQRIQEDWWDFWRYRQHSLYAERLERFMAAFGRSQVLVLIFEEMTADLSGALREVFRFLEVDEGFAPSGLGVAFNKGGKPRSRAAERALNLLAGAVVGVRRMVPGSLYNAARRWGYALMNWNRVATSSRLDEATYRQLLGEFEDDIRATETLLGRSLDLWRR